MLKTVPKSFIIYCLTVLGFLLFLFANRCSQEKSSKQDLQTKSTLVSTQIIPGDSAPVEVQRKEKAPKPRLVFIHDTLKIPADIDSALVFKDYFAKYYYCDSIWSDDSSVLVIIKDTVTRNKIASRKPYIQNLRQTKIINTYTTEKEQARKFYAGPLFGLGYDRRLAAGLSLMYISKTERPVTYSYDAINKMHFGTLFFRLK